MLTTLKDIFRPTWRKVVTTVLVACAISLLDRFAERGHGSGIAPIVGIPFALPRDLAYSIAQSLGIGDPILRMGVHSLFAIFYWYALLCIGSYWLLGSLRRRYSLPEVRLRAFLLPTWTRVIATIVVGALVMYLALIFVAYFPTSASYVAPPLLLPYLLLGWLEVYDNTQALFVFFVSGFLYWYLVVSLATYLFARFALARPRKGEPNP